MTREQAILNASACENYLATYEPTAYLTKDIGPYYVSLHYFDMKKTDEEVLAILRRLDYLREAGTTERVIRNKELNQITFTIYWDYDSYGME